MSLTNSEMKKEFEDGLRYEEHAEPYMDEKAHPQAYENMIKAVGVGDDPINPYHYKNKGIETIDCMKAISTDEEFQGHCRLTAIKYLSRFGKKDDEAQEVKKAIWYLEKLVESLEENK